MLVQTTLIKCSGTGMDRQTPHTHTYTRIRGLLRRRAGSVDVVKHIVHVNKGGKEKWSSS